jgi:hypothetical protein
MNRVLQESWSDARTLAYPLLPRLVVTDGAGAHASLAALEYLAC